VLLCLGQFLCVCVPTLHYSPSDSASASETLQL